jgi:hypothetical protein
MNKITLLLLALSLSLFSCGESKDDKSEQIEKDDKSEQIENETAKIIVAQNNAINNYKEYLNSVAAMNMASALNRSQPGWRQRNYDAQVAKFQVQESVSSFKIKYGEAETNKLMIKLDNNSQSKMNRGIGY